MDFYYRLESEGKVKEDQKEPNIYPFIYYVVAFKELTTCRNSGFGVSPIPFTAIHEYFKIFGIGDFEEFLYLIRVMDNRLIELQTQKNRAKEKAESSGRQAGKKN